MCIQRDQAASMSECIRQDELRLCLGKIVRLSVCKQSEMCNQVSAVYPDVRVRSVRDEPDVLCYYSMHRRLQFWHDSRIQWGYLCVLSFQEC